MNWLALFTASILLAADRLAKLYFLKDSFQLTGKIIHLKLVKNPRLFSLEINPIFLIAFSFLILAVVLAMLVKACKNKENLLFASLLLIALGGLSNLYDRLTLGWVVDYIWIYPLPFSVFNLADMMIMAGCILILLRLLKKK